MTVVDPVPLLGLHEPGEFLNGGDHDAALRVGQMPGELARRGGRVRRALLEPVVFALRLPVEVFAVHDEQHFVHSRHPGCELRRLERGQRLARTGRVPHVAAGGDRAELPVVRGDLDLLQDALRRHDLVRAHHEQGAVGGQHAVAGEDRQDRVSREERLREAAQVADGGVRRIRPPRRELERVAGAAHAGPARRVVDVLTAGRGAVVLRERAVADHEQLHVVEQPRPGPERVALVAVDLVERLPDVDPAAFQLHMHQRQTVHEDGHVVPVGPRALDRVLVDHLQPVVVDAGLVDDRDVLRRTVVASEGVHVVLLHPHRLLHGAVVGAQQVLRAEPTPLRIAERDAIERLELCAEVREQVRLRSDREVLVGLLAQQSDELPFEVGLRLVPARTGRIGHELGHHGRLR